MVRLKHRYLLVDLLYPASEASATSDTAAPPCLRFRAPTPDSLTPALLARLVREEVAAMFGDWGVGRLGGAGAGSLSGELFYIFFVFVFVVFFLAKNPR